MKITTDVLPGGSGICTRVCARETFDPHGIARNCTGTTIRANDEHGKRSRVTISTGDLSRGRKFARVRVIYLTLTESRQIARVPQFDQMTKIGSDRARKLQPVRSQENREICARVRARQRFDSLGIARNRTGTTIRPTDEDGRRSRMKISTGELSEG